MKCKYNTIIEDILARCLIIEEGPRDADMTFENLFIRKAKFGLGITQVRGKWYH